MAVHHVDVTHHPTPIPAGLARTASPVWIETRPHIRRSASIGSDILAAYGKRRDVAGKGRNENADLTLALAWMHAYDATALVLTEAQRLTPLVLRQAVALARNAQLPLWLLHRTPRTDAFLLSLERHHAHPMRVSDIPEPLTRFPVASGRPTLDVPIPPAPFHAFLSTCRAALTPSAYQRVRGLHHTTAQRLSDSLDATGTDTDAVARLVESLLLAAPEDDQLIVEIRALQLACWHHDLYLKTDLSRLLVSPERQTTDATTVDEFLVVYRQPHRALCVALAMHQVGVAEMTPLRLKDSNAQAAVITTRSNRRIVLHEHAAAALRAQLFLRTISRGAPTDRLLDVTERAISQCLNDANLDLNIRVHGRRAERHIHPRRWLANLGLSTYGLP